MAVSSSTVQLSWSALRFEIHTWSSSTVKRSDTSALPGSLSETAGLIEQQGREVLVAPADITDDASLGAAATLVLERWGHVDVVVHNARYRALDQFAEHFGISKPVGTALPGLDFVALAAGQGVPGVRVERPDELAPALTDALRSPGPVVVDVIVR